MHSHKIRHYKKRKYTKKHGGAAANNSIHSPSPSPSRRSSTRRLSTRKSSPSRTSSLPSKALSSLSHTNSNSNNSPVIKPPPVSSLHRTLFDSIRGGIRNHALDSKDQSKGISESMFLFATPTKLINNLLFSLYNENLIRTTNKEKPKSMMMSLLELSGKENKGHIYITISEEPNSDANFYHKLADLILMLKIILYGQAEASQKRTDLGDKIELIDGEYHLEELKQIMKLPKYTYRTDFSEHKDITGIFPLKQRNLSNKIKKVKIVCNEKYIEARREGVSFEPFYKPDKNKPQYIACNSGSICSESKIFSYLHDKKLFDKIKGAIAYWFGDGNLDGGCQGDKPSDCHIHPKYCYYAGEEKYILKIMIDVLKNHNSISKELQEILDTNRKLQLYMFAPYALPCPGCTLNSFRYNNNIRAVWKHDVCLERHPDIEDPRKRRGVAKAQEVAVKHA